MNRRLLSRSGFTLVELVVTLVASTLLITGAFCAQQAVPLDRNKVRCMGNLRTLGQALAQYTQEEGYYPGGHWQAGRYWIYVWHARLRQQLGGRAESFLCPSNPVEFAWVPQYQEGYRPPPPDKGWPRYGYFVDEVPHFGPSDRPFSYGYNESGNRERFDAPQRGLGMHPDTEDYENFGELAELPVTRVVNPANLIAIGDALADGIADHGMVGRPYHTVRSNWPGARHSDGANMLLCDGHVEWNRRPDWVTSKYLLDNGIEQGVGNSLSAQRRWNNDDEPHMKSDLSDSEP